MDDEALEAKKRIIKQEKQLETNSYPQRIFPKTYQQ